MFGMPKIDLFAALAYIASGGLAATFVAVGVFLPHEQSTILGIGAIVTGLAGLLTRLFKNPSTPQEPK